MKNHRSSNQLRKRRNFPNDEWTYWRERHPRAARFEKMAEGTFASACSVEEFILRAKQEKYCSKNWTRCKFAWKIFKNEIRGQEIWSYLSCWAEWIHWPFYHLRPHLRWHRVRANFASKCNCQLRPTLKEKGYFASVINYLVFEKTRKVPQCKRNQLKKQGKGNR